MELPIELYRQIFKTAWLGIAVSDEQGAIVAANDYMLRVGNFTENEIIGRMASDLYVGGALARREMIDMVKRQGGVEDQIVEFKKKDGSTFQAKMSLRQVIADGRRYMVATFRDLSS